MGDLSFLVNGNPSSPSSITDSIRTLKQCSIIFTDAWKDTPQDLITASEVSSKAMKCLDHIINEIMRNRDQLRSAGTYATSPLKTHLDGFAGLSVSPVTRNNQDDLPRLGAGNGNLNFTGLTPSTISMEQLLNKIKHRRTNSLNFRLDLPDLHALIVGVDKMNGNPDCIVEFHIRHFCASCMNIAQIL